MTRAQAAYAELRAAHTLLSLMARFCADTYYFGRFQEWSLELTSMQRDDPEAAAAVAAARRALAALSPDVLTGAADVIGLFLQGYGDALAAVPDDVMARQAEKWPGWQKP